MKLKFYHGTSAKNAKLLIKNGASKLYLTLDDEQAQYYAEVASDEDGSKPTILIVEVEDNILYADLPSFNEPLSYVLEINNLSEKDWFESIKSGEIIYPSVRDWKTSLKYTKTLLAMGKIESGSIYLGDLGSEYLTEISSLIHDPQYTLKT